MAKVAWANVGSKIITRLNKLGFLDENTYTPSSGDTITWDGSEWVPDNTTYQSTIESMWVPATALTATFGSPSLGTANRHPIWLLDQSAAAELVGTGVRLPDGWTTMNVELWWTNPGAGSGDVRMRLDHIFEGDGDTLANPTSGTEQTATAPGQNVVEVTTLVSGAAVTADELLTFAVARLGGAGADTLGNDAGVLGVRFVKAS